MGRLLLIVGMAFWLAVPHADAQAERRVALVVGNARYQNAGTLTNPVNDADDVAAKLRAIGFTVIEGTDLGKRELERKVGEFSDALDGASAGMFFYSGHGLQVDGRNFIVPVDAQLDVPVKLQLEAVPMDEILDIMEQQAPTSLVFLDACRNNPFTRSPTLAATRGAVPLNQGLAQFDSTRGSFIAFSTAPGSVAMDGAGRNSPFVEALLKHIAEPGQSINDLMIAVRRDVVAETRNLQRPWEQGSLLQRFEFVPAGAVAAAAESAPPPAAQSNATQVASLDRSVGDAASIAIFLKQDYLAADAAAIPQAVRRIYGEHATIYGTPLDLDAIVRVKSDWFARFSSWKLALDEGSLTVTPQPSGGSLAVFDMSYDYAPKDGSPHLAGRARVWLGLAKRDGGWRVVSETSQ